MVKRAVIIMILLILSAGTVWSQEVDDEETSCCGMAMNQLIFVRFGWTEYSMAGVSDDFVQSGSKSGITFGGFTQYPLGGNLFVQPEIRYVSKGVKKTHSYETYPLGVAGKISAANADNESTETASLGYIQIPVLLCYEIPLKGKLKPRVLFGPALAFNISGKDEVSGFGDFDGKYDINNLKKVDFSGMIGAGVSFPIGKLTCGLDVIYDRSLSSAFSDVTSEELANDLNEELWTKTDPLTGQRTTEAVDFKNSGFSIQASMMLPIGKGKQ